MLGDDDEARAAASAPQPSATFLKTLIRQLDRRERHGLCDKLATAEREERCLRRAVSVMVVLFMLSVAGMFYCSLLLPEVYDGPSYSVIQCLSVLALGSLISNTVFLAYLFWHRTAMNRLHGECRRLILELLQAQAREPSSPRPAERLSMAPMPAQ
jgi:hypothetical protein